MTMAEDQEAAEKRASARSSPQALKRERISAAYGTTEVVPFSELARIRFFRSGKLVPFPFRSEV
jgi:hypothetical protein